MTDRARDFINRAGDAGSTLKLQGSWVVSYPPLPVPMMIELSEISDEVAEILKAESNKD